MTIKNISNMLRDVDVSHEFVEVDYEHEKDRILFNDDNFDRTIKLNQKTNMIELFVNISKTKKKKWDEKQTPEQNSACGREKNRFTKEVFNKLDIEFKLPEWKPSATTQKFEGSKNPVATPISAPVTKFVEKDSGFEFPDFDAEEVSDAAIIRSLGDESPYDKK